MMLVYWCNVILSFFQCLLLSTVIAKTLNSSSQSSLFFKSPTKQKSSFLSTPRKLSSLNQLTHQLQDYVSWRPDLEAMAIDAFILNWHGYANPPWNLHSCQLSQIFQDSPRFITLSGSPRKLLLCPGSQLEDSLHYTS